MLSAAGSSTATLALYGQALEQHQGGYLSFQREITAIIKENNTLTVHVDSRFVWPSSGAASGRILVLPARDHCNHQREQYPHSPCRLAFCQHSACRQPEPKS